MEMADLLISSTFQSSVFIDLLDIGEVKYYL